MECRASKSQKDVFANFETFFLSGNFETFRTGTGARATTRERPTRESSLLNIGSSRCVVGPATWAMAHYLRPSSITD